MESTFFFLLTHCFSFFFQICLFLLLDHWIPSASGRCFGWHLRRSIRVYASVTARHKWADLPNLLLPIRGLLPFIDERKCSQCQDRMTLPHISISQGTLQSSEIAAQPQPPLEKSSCCLCQCLVILSTVDIWSGEAMAAIEFHLGLNAILSAFARDNST